MADEMAGLNVFVVVSRHWLTEERTGTRAGPWTECRMQSRRFLGNARGNSSDRFADRVALGPLLSRALPTTPIQRAARPASTYKSTSDDCHVYNQKMPNTCQPTFDIAQRVFLHLSDAPSRAY